MNNLSKHSYMCVSQWKHRNKTETVKLIAKKVKEIFKKSWFFSVKMVQKRTWSEWRRMKFFYNNEDIVKRQMKYELNSLWAQTKCSSTGNSRETPASASQTALWLMGINMSEYNWELYSSLTLNDRIFKSVLKCKKKQWGIGSSLPVIVWSWAAAFAISLPLQPEKG